MKHGDTILLIGAEGQIGWELARSLPSRGAVIATRRAEAFPSQSTHVALDLGQPQSIRAAVRQVRPGLIVNAAAYTDVDGAEKAPQTATTINAEVPGILAEEARRLGAALVHYSTEYVFDGGGTRAWREEDRPNPLNEYGRSKLAGEEAIRETGAAHLILRTSWVYSARRSNFLTTMLRLGETRETLRVVRDQIGAPTSARCVADVTVQILAQAKGRFAEFLATEGGAGGTLHVCCAGETSWHGFAEAIFARARDHDVPLKVRDVKAVPSTDYPAAAQRPRNSRLDCGRLRERFSLDPPDWRAALERCFSELLSTASG